MSKKISIQELAAIIAERTDKTKKLSEDFLRAFQSVIEEGLEKDGLVKIKGLGTFKLVWNEPRRSVNIQTGQEYTIPGHNKVSFTPENSIKELLNTTVSSNETTEKFGVDPLKKLNEQAEEITGLLAELQGMKQDEEPKQEPVVVPVVAEEKPKEEAVEISPVVEYTPKPVEPTPVATPTPQPAPVYTPTPIVTPPTSTPAATTSTTIPPTPTRDIPVKEKRRFPWKWIILILLLLLILGCAAVWYFNLCPKVTKPIEEKITVWIPQKANAEENAEPQVITVRSNDTIWIDKTDTIAEVKDSIQVTPQPVAASQSSIFDQKREYNNFITTETITEGNTLTRVALKYYGHRNFWVYIYEANKEKIAHPDKLPVGFTVKIPKLSPDLINANNPECVKYAGELEVKYANK